MNTLAGKGDSRRQRRRQSTPTSQVVVGGNKLSKVRSLIILLSEEGFTSFSINNLTNFFSEKKSKMKLSGVSFFWEHAARDPRLQLGKKEGLVTCSKWKMAAASEFPTELATRPLGLVALIGLDIHNKPLHKAIWESFSVNRHPERVPLSFRLLSIDHEFPKAKSKVSRYDISIWLLHTRRICYWTVFVVKVFNQ